ARQRFVAALLFIAGIVRPLRLREVGNVVAAPLPFRFIPPDEFLALTPRLAVRRRRTSVVEDAAIEQPPESPSVSIGTARLALLRFVLVRVVDAGVDPAAAARRAVTLQLTEVLARRAVNLAQHSICILILVVPRERAQSRVAFLSRR